MGLKDLPVDRRATTLEAEERACGIFSVFVATGLLFARDFRPVVADAILAAATKKLGERNDRKSLGEAGRVGEQLQNILPPWSSSPNTFLVRRMKHFPFPFTSAAFAGVMHFRISLQ